MNQILIERVNPVWAADPRNYTGAAMTAKWVSMKNYTNLTIMIITGAWAAGTAAVTLSQATAVAGTSAKALALEAQYNDLTTSGINVRTAVVSNTFTIGTANKLFVIEVDALDLDVAGGFDCVTLAVASPGVNADFYGVLYLLHGSRYQGAAQPNALVD